MFNVAVGDMIKHIGGGYVAIVVKINLHGYPHLAEVEWITGSNGRGSVNLEDCKVISQ